MGEAKRRGNFEERVKQSLERDAKKLAAEQIASEHPISINPKRTILSRIAMAAMVASVLKPRSESLD